MERKVLRRSVSLWLLLLVACGAPAKHAATPTPASPNVTLSIVGTNDVHGHVDVLPRFGGFMRNLRDARAKDGGGVILVDGGDLFQGTLESNMNEGKSVIAAYNVLGYTASAIGNHEFDFGPTGPATTPRTPDDNPRGALFERFAEARFPFLSANITDAAGKPITWPDQKPAMLITVDGVRVGIVGLSTTSTPSTTASANVKDLSFTDPAAALDAQAKALRAQGATVIVAIAHLGGKCANLDHADDPSSCAEDEEVMHVLEHITPGVLDVFVAGHTHQFMAHRIRGVAVIESGSMGRAFGRVDLSVDRRTGRVTNVSIAKPTTLCDKPKDATACAPATYEGAPVIDDARVTAALVPFMAEAERVKNESLGVEVEKTFDTSLTQETALGNLLADLILTARPTADVAVMNAGGIRTRMPAGTLTYGRFFEVFPFDNRFATVQATGKTFGDVLRKNLLGEHGLLSISGLTAVVTCHGKELAVELRRPNGKRVKDDEPITVMASDFLATGGDAVLDTLPHVIEEGPTMRDELVRVLRDRAGNLNPDDPELYDPAHRRYAFPANVRECH